MTHLITIPTVWQGLAYWYRWELFGVFTWCLIVHIYDLEHWHDASYDFGLWIDWIHKDEKLGVWLDD